MRHVIDQVQDLLEGLHSLRLQQKELLNCTESGEVDELPLTDFETYQRLQLEREAKGKFLTKVSGASDDLSILLGQLTRLADERQSIMNRNQIENPLDLPLKDLQVFMNLWCMSDRVAGMLDYILSKNICP